MKAYKVKDVPVGSLFSLADPEVFASKDGPPIYLRIEKTKSLVDEWNKNFNQNSSDWIREGEELSLSESGYLCKWNLDLNCYLRAKEPHDPRPKQYWDAFEKRYEACLAPSRGSAIKRKDIKSGQVFRRFNPSFYIGMLYMAIERNQDTLNYFKQQGSFDEGLLFMLDDKGWCWNCSPNDLVVPVDDHDHTLADKFVGAYRNNIAGKEGFLNIPLFCSDEDLRTKQRRKDIKSGQFFTDYPCNRGVYLAVERNADTEFFFMKSHDAAPSFLSADQMLCISSDARMLTTHKESFVTLAEDNPSLRDQLASIYSDALKEYCADAKKEPAGLPLFFTEPVFYSPLLGMNHVRTLPPKGTDKQAFVEAKFCNPLTVPQHASVAYRQAFAEAIPPRTLVTHYPKQADDNNLVFLTIERNASSEKAYFLSHGHSKPKDIHGMLFCLDRNGDVFPLNPQDKLYILPDDARKQSYIDAYCDRYANRVQNEGSMIKYLVPGTFFADTKPGGDSYLAIPRSKENDGDFHKYYPNAVELREDEVIAINKFGSPVRYSGSKDVVILVMQSAESNKLTTEYLTAYYRKFAHVPDGLKACANKCYEIIEREDCAMARAAHAHLQPVSIRFGPELSIVKDDPADELPQIVRRRDIPVGSFFSFEKNGDRLLAIDSTPICEKVLGMKLGQGRLPYLSIFGGVCWCEDVKWVWPRGEDSPLAIKLAMAWVVAAKDLIADKNWTAASATGVSIPASEIAKSLEIVKAADHVVSVKGHFTGFKVQPPANDLDATQRLYQDQRDYFKREEQKAKDEAIRRVQEQLATFIPDKRLATDCKGEDNRNKELVCAKGCLFNSFHNAECAARSLSELDKHGWGNVSREEEQDVRSAITELQTFLKKWKKKHGNVVKRD